MGTVDSFISSLDKLTNPDNPQIRLIANFLQVHPRNLELNDEEISGTYMKHEKTLVGWVI